MTKKIIDKKYKKELKRKLLHLSSLWIPVFIYLFPKNICIAVLGALLLGNIIIEYLNYKKNPVTRKYLGFVFLKLSRSFELKKNQIRFSGSVFVLLASLFAVIFFYQNVAIISITIMLISDTVAALWGRAFGKIKIFDGKSVEGSLAFFTSAIITSIVLDNLLPFNYSIVIACITATFFEIYSKKLRLDDNLAITMSLGTMLTIL
ncbi:MAG: hypothetical protein LBR70_05940 [Lactobacillaceae bacterium]|jgi:dolichol kinase|nr:hypothetical protein [Lactobacillaceae bacterium]